MTSLQERFYQSVPRYTSYPVATCWSKESVEELKQTYQTVQRPISLYVHIPFCRKQCFYCGCSMVVNRKSAVIDQYLSYLEKEMQLVAYKLQNKQVVEIHIGGGSPSGLSLEQLERLFLLLTSNFKFSVETTISIEIDPRSDQCEEKLVLLKKLGVTRVSFGVQDFCPSVQDAIGRNQTEEETIRAVYAAKALNFSGVNLDLIYGLPYQTSSSFQESCRKAVILKPERISLFSFAYLPEIKRHQQVIKEDSLPTAEEKFAIYSKARELFQKANYIAIGMDHFAAPCDELAIAYKETRITRTFQGYSVDRGTVIIGLGVTAISSLDEAYAQNEKELAQYYGRLDRGELPIERGIVLSFDDIVRRFVIRALMCSFYVSKKEVEVQFGICFSTYFKQELVRLKEYSDLVIESEDFLTVTSAGQLLVRIIASCFDRYLTASASRPFSKSV